MQKDINISIAAGEALLFLESSFGGVSVEDFEQFLCVQGVDAYQVVDLLLSKDLISISKNYEGAGIVSLTGVFLGLELHHV
ncbi:MAG: hypothetical protein HQL14_08745 [Candidatus Omnitrophica bacterium]|nr:hypothetical protein [Candidatus Omnitrophota bacterium]